MWGGGRRCGEVRGGLEGWDEAWRGGRRCGEGVGGRYIAVKASINEASGAEEEIRRLHCSSVVTC